MYLEPTPNSCSQPGCYASPTGQCAEGISKEHYISHGILKTIAVGGPIQVSGLPWVIDDTVTLYPSNLWSKILCNRHNKVLKGLDTVANRFFHQLFTIPKQFNDFGPDSVFLVNGADLELWFLKLLCGLCAVYRPHDQDHWEAPSEWLSILFRQKTFDYNAGQGLHCGAWIGHQNNVGNYTQITFYHRESDNSIAGIQANMGGVSFFLSLQKMMRAERSLLHPNILTFSRSGSKRKIHLALGWVNFPSGKTLTIEYQ